MQEMVEPDRTIMIVSIIGLVIIWGSVAYRKFAQKGGAGAVGAAVSDAAAASGEQESSGEAGKGKKRRKNR